VTVSIKPQDVRMSPNMKQQFIAEVAGAMNSAVTWAVTEDGGGTVDSAGQYTAPAATGTFHVTATSVADTKASASVTITVLPGGSGVAVSVAPNPATVVAGQKQQFVASVASIAGQGQGVTWTVVEMNGGAIDQTGLYTAPMTVGTFHVHAIAQADASAIGEAVVTVTPAMVMQPVRVTVNPATLQLGAGETHTFTATVTGTTTTGVTWAITEGGAGGTVTAGGFYTAPTSPGTYHLVATSTADTTAKATATITVIPVVISVSPPTALVEIGSTQAFTATVAGAANTQATWAVTEGTTGGSVTSSGVYTPPSTPGTYHVVATSVADGTKSSNATVTVINPVTVLLAPSTANLTTQQTQQFTATVMGSTNQVVTWNVVEGAIGGTITSTGLYTAPAVTSTQVFHVSATPDANPAKVVQATVTVAPGVGVQVTPLAVTLQPAATQQFTASVTGSSNTAVTWSIQEGAGGGTVSTTGLYTAPSASGTYHVVAASAADNTKRGVATVIVLGSPVDVSGTITYSGTKTGRVYVSLGTSDTSAGLAGTSVALVNGTATFTLRGVQQRGAFKVRAFMDTLDSGMYHLATDPFVSVSVTVANTALTGVTVALVDSTWNGFFSTATPAISRVIATDGSAAVLYDPALTSGRDECSRYRVYWNTSATVSGSQNIGSMTFNANAPHLIVVRGLTNGDHLYFTMDCPDSLLGGFAPTFGPVTVGPTSGGFTLNGTVDSSALTTLTNAPLYVFAVSSTSGFLTKVLGPTAQQNWSIAGLSAGTYSVYTFRDASDDGKLTPTDPSNFFDPQTVTVNGNQTAAPIVLSGANAVAKVTTSHVFDSGSESYGLRFVVRPNLKRPVKATLASGPKLALPLDLPLDENGGARHTVSLALGNIAPVSDDTYSISVTYSDLTTETVTAKVVAVLPVPVVTSPTSTTTNTTPSFTWQALGSDVYAYFRLYSWTYAGIGNLASLLGSADAVPSSTTTLLYSDIHPSGASLSSAILPYWYELTAVDGYGNWSERIDSFTVQ
jgi:hypothetical protein